MQPQFTSLLFVGAASAHILGRTVPSRCAVPEPSEQQKAEAKALLEIERASAKLGVSRIAADISVNTYIHVVSSSESKFISEPQLKDQVDYMNKAYNPHGVSFNVADTDFTVNSDWAAGNGEVAMKTALRQGSYSDLNIYFVDTPKLDGFVALGYCHFPESGVAENSTTFVKDGCVIESETVPGGSETDFDLGGTAVHEVGHWFNLFHTFQGGCNGGDQVDDTPAQGRQTSGCPARSDTCPNVAGDDPIHNYMDYSTDICYTEFTAGQEARIHSAWETYRQ